MPVRVICHFVNSALANSWLEYRDFHRTYRTVEKDTLNLLSFCESFAETLIKADIVKCLSLGRPRRDENQPPPKNKPNSPAVGPVHCVRYDGYDHFPKHIDGLGQLCKLEGCTGRSRIKCQKCEVFLSLNKSNNCFVAFHK